MSRWIRGSGLILVTCLALFAEPAHVFGRGVDCDTVLKLHATRKQQLEACLTALAKLDEKTEGYVISILTQRIHELTDAVSKAEQFSQCLRRGSSGAYHGRGTLVETPETGSCAELTSVYITLSRKSSLLGRKEHSPFSRASEQEKAELRATLELLGRVKQILESKCSSASRPQAPPRQDRGKPGVKDE